MAGSCENVIYRENLKDMEQIYLAQYMVQWPALMIRHLSSEIRSFIFLSGCYSNFLCQSANIRLLPSLKEVPFVASISHFSKTSPQKCYIFFFKFA
jgi:hypothetical protein